MVLTTLIKWRNKYEGVSLMNLGGSKGFMEPPFGFSFDEKLWKPGLQQNPPI